MPAIHTSVHSTGEATRPPTMSPRTELVRCEIGLTFTNDCSQPGSVVVETNTLLPNVSGKMVRNRMPCTEPDVRANMPTSTDTQHRHNAKPTDSAHAARAASGLV